MCNFGADWPHKNVFKEKGFNFTFKAKRTCNFSDIAMPIFLEDGDNVFEQKRFNRTRIIIQRFLSFWLCLRTLRKAWTQKTSVTRQSQHFTNSFYTRIKPNNLAQPVTLMTSVRVYAFWICDQDIQHPDWDFPQFVWCLQANAGIVPHTSPPSLLYLSFRYDKSASSNNSTLYHLSYDGIVKWGKNKSSIKN